MACFVVRIEALDRIPAQIKAGNFIPAGTVRLKFKKDLARREALLEQPSGSAPATHR
jgi:hypothetical protein